MPRNYWQCECGWSVAWAITGRARDDGDPGFLLMAHVRAAHPGWIVETRPATLDDILQRGLLRPGAPTPGPADVARILGRTEG